MTLLHPRKTKLEGVRSFCQPRPEAEMRPSPRTFRLVQGQYFSLDLAGGNFFGALLSWFRVHFRLFDSILGNLCTEPSVLSLKPGLLPAAN